MFNLGTMAFGVLNALDFAYRERQSCNWKSPITTWCRGAGLLIVLILRYAKQVDLVSNLESSLYYMSSAVASKISCSFSGDKMAKSSFWYIYLFPLMLN